MWYVSNDTVSCNEGDPYKTILKLTGCEDGKFTCNDGQCVDMVSRCDQMIDCKDKSDEEGCQILHVDKSYHKNIAPMNATKKARVNVSLVFLSINEINEVFKTIGIKFRIILKWYETNRVAFHNLKETYSFNVLSESEVKLLWTPYVIFANTNDDEATVVDNMFKYVKTNIAISREGAFTRSPMTTVDEIEIFKVFL